MFRGVNVGEEFYSNDFSYKGIRVEDTPQTQICRWEQDHYAHTANEGQVRIQYKCLIPLYVLPEMKLFVLIISKTEL